MRRAHLAMLPGFQASLTKMLGLSNTISVTHVTDCCDSTAEPWSWFSGNRESPPKTKARISVYRTPSIAPIRLDLSGPQNSQWTHDSGAGFRFESAITSIRVNNSDTFGHAFAEGSCVLSLRRKHKCITANRATTKKLPCYTIRQNVFDCNAMRRLVWLQTRSVAGCDCQTKEILIGVRRKVPGKRATYSIESRKRAIRIDCHAAAVSVQKRSCPRACNVG